MMFNWHKRTALIVDSSPTILYYHSMLMKRMHYAVLTASTPRDALQILRNTVPTVVLTGITFADMGGADFIKRLKKNERSKTIPVIVLTSIDDAAMRAKCLSAGGAACLSKPVYPSCLFWTVQDVTESRPRAHIRIKTLLKAIVGGRAAEANAGAEFATSISEGGLFLKTHSPRQKDELLPVTITVNGRDISAKAVVVHVQTMGKGVFKEPGMGMRFVEISEEDRDYLHRYIHERLTSDIEHCMQVKTAA